jgi:3',5'-cyclic-AMP phosphodiesterase
VHGLGRHRPGVGGEWRVLSSRTIAHAAEAPAADFTFAQISDTHIGFKGQANADPVATMQESIARLIPLSKS